MVVSSVVESEDVLRFEDISSDWVQEFAKQVRFHAAIRKHGCPTRCAARSAYSPPSLSL